MSPKWLTRLVTPSNISKRINPPVPVFRCEVDECQHEAEWHLVLSKCRHALLVCAEHYVVLQEMEAGTVPVPQGWIMTFEHRKDCWISGNLLEWRELA